MNKFLNTVSLAMVLLALFSAFVISWEIRFSRIAVGQLREQAAIIANAVWNFDEEGALKYLQAAALISDYESITVFAVNADKPFIEVRGPEAHFLETLFLRAGLISQKELRTSIMHKEKGTVIGWLQVVRWHKTVYVYGYLFLVMGLFLLAFKYFLQTVRAKATLEIAVGERTAELQKSRETLSLILNTVPQAVFWKDREGSYLGCNRVFAVIVGLNEPSQVVGKTDFGLPWTREEAEAYCAVDGDVIRNNRPEFRIIEQVQAASGRRLWVDTSKVPLCDAAGRPFAVLGVFEDITERKQAEAREKVLMAKLEQGGRMEALGLLAGGVAHDLNNVLGPLVVLPDMISGYIERHGSPDDPEYADVRQDVQILKTSALRAAAVVNDLVVMGRRGQFKKTLIDVNQVVRQVIDSNQIRAIQDKRPDVKIVSELTAESTACLGSDSRLIRVVANLVGNAAEAIEGRGDVVVRTGRKVFAESYQGYEDVPAGEYVIVEVADTGCGIDSKIIARIFEPFFSTKEPSERSGSGLGLSVVHGLVKDHDGFLDVKSEPGKGATFTVYLPAEEAIVSEMPAATIVVGGHERILIVDDEPGQLVLARRALMKLGYKPTVVSNGEEAVKLFQEAVQAGKPTPFDLVMTDMCMEGLDGMVVCRKILQLYPTQKLIIISGYSVQEKQNQVKAMGVDWLGKPYTLEDLARAVRARLDRRME